MFFSFLYLFSMKLISANRKALDWSLRFAASHLGLFCLPISHKKDARLIWVNMSEDSDDSETAYGAWPNENRISPIVLAP